MSGIIPKLKVGDKLNIERYEGNINMDKKGMLSSQLIDVDKKKELIYIAVPSYKGTPHLLRNNQKIGISYYRDAGEYQFFAEVLKQVDKNIRAFVVKPTSELTKIQRRNYYRLPVSVNISIEIKSNTGTRRSESITKDISGGGIKAISDDKFEEGEGVRVEIYLDDDISVTAEGIVVRSIEDRVNRNYEVGIMFDKITQANQDRIHTFIFEKQRLLRKKGLI